MFSQEFVILACLESVDSEIDMKAKTFAAYEARNSLTKLIGLFVSLSVIVSHPAK